jgi:hypothetical protein
MNYASTLDEVLALHPHEFRRRLCLVKTPSVTVIDVVAVAPGAAISGNVNDNVGTSGNVDVAWPALKYNSYMELHDHIEDSRLKGIIAMLFKRLCRKTKDKADTNKWIPNKYGIAYLIGRDTSQSLLVFVPKNSEGVVVEDGQSVFDFRRYAHEMEDDEGYCRSAQLQAAYTFAKNRMKQNSAMMIDKNESTPKSPPAVKAVPGKINEKPSSWGIDVGSKAKHVGARIVATLLTPFRGAVASSGTDVVESADTEIESDVDELQATALQSMVSPSDVEGAAALDDSVSIGDSPSNDIGKSADSEGVVQCLLYPDSTGAAVTPPEVDSLVGGKRKSGKSRNRKKRKKVRSNNHNVKGGCRVVNTPLTNEPEQRDCMERALHSLLTPKEKEMVISEPFPLPSDHGGDVSIAISNMWLMKYGMMLEPVTSRYDTKKGGLLYNLLQDLESRLVIKVVLTMCDGGIADHFIAYDGTTLHDVPHSIKPLRDDRRKKRNCLAIFKKLYPTKNYLAFQVTNVFELCTVKN